MNTKVIIGLLVGTFILIGGSYGLISLTDKTSQIQATEQAKAEVLGATSHDWGTIGINDGIVKKTFMVKNSGSEPLQLFNVSTSCMCTTAQVRIGDELSPAFGMHSQSGYISEVPTGETAEIMVAFDPAFHGPSGTGPITRQIMVETNDKSNPQLSFTAEAVVVSQIE